MPVTINSSLTHSVSIAMSSTLSSGGETSASAVSLDASLAVGGTDAPTGDDGVVVITAETTALGEDTLALTDIDALLTVTDWGSLVSVDMSLVAEASAGAGGALYTATGATVATGGASMKFAFALDTTETTMSSAGSTSTSTSDMSLFAVGGIASGGQPAGAAATAGAVGSAGAPLPEPADIDGLGGNVAIAEITADAIGVDSFVDIAVDVLTIEDQLSLIAAQLTLAVG